MLDWLILGWSEPFGRFVGQARWLRAGEEFSWPGFLVARRASFDHLVGAGEE
jgi:hypothetical protein